MNNSNISATAGVKSPNDALAAARSIPAAGAIKSTQSKFRTTVTTAATATSKSLSSNNTTSKNTEITSRT